MKAARIDEKMIDKNIDKIVAGETPGVNRTAQRKPPRLGQTFSKSAIQNAAKWAKVATAMGAVVIVGGAQFANGAYVDAGEKAGMKMADKTGLMRLLRVTWNDDDLPCHTFDLKWRDGEVRVRFEKDTKGNWIVVYKIKRNEDGIVIESEPYIKPGDLPLDSKPGNPFFNP